MEIFLLPDFKQIKQPAQHSTAELIDEFDE
jgi:hypothetical protein